MRSHMTLNYNIKLWSLSQGQVASFFSSIALLLLWKPLRHILSILRGPPSFLYCGYRRRDSRQKTLAGAGVTWRAWRWVPGGGRRKPRPRTGPPSSLGRAARLAAATSASRFGRTSFKGALRKETLYDACPSRRPQMFRLRRQRGCHGDGTLRAEPGASAPVAMATWGTFRPVES